MRKIYYLGYIIFEVGTEFVVSIDNSFHKTLISAKAHIDYLTK
jgi:hypothetical protein